MSTAVAANSVETDATPEAHDGPEHDYHLVDPSPWPLLTAFAAMLVCIMVIVTFQNKGGAFSGHSSIVWVPEFSEQLATLNAGIAANQTDFQLREAMLSLGAVEAGGLYLAPHSYLWNEAAAAIFAGGNTATALSELGAILGPDAVSIDESGQLIVAPSAPITCGLFSLFACEIQGDGTFARVGLAFGFGIAPFFVGLLPLIFCMGMWWRDVVREAHVEGHHTPIVQLGLRYGMLLFIVSEIFFFVAFFWAFFSFSLFEPWPSEEFIAAMEAQGKNLHAFNPLGIPLYNTVILLLSGTTVTQAHEALRENRQIAFRNWLAVTVALGIVFTAVQVYEYTQLPFGFSDFNYGSAFFAATGFHGFHVLVGTLFLAVCWLRARANQFTADHHFGFEAAAWYWHFVDVVWVFLYVAIYWGLFVTVPTLH